MTTTDADFRRAVTDGCARDAATVYDLLCEFTHHLDADYDGAYTITIGAVRAHFTPHGVQLTYPDPYDTDRPEVTVTVASDHTFGALHTLITALCQAVNP